MDIFLTEDIIIKAGEEYNLEPALIHAIISVESKGSGFIDSTILKPIILFEGHIFWKELKRVGINPVELQKGNKSILYPIWTNDWYYEGNGEYLRLWAALKINREAALRSTSWGLFQIMGFNHVLAGYNDIEEFVIDNYKSELLQLKMFLNFIVNTNLIDSLREKEFSKFAKGYNGSGYRKNKYDTKLEKAYVEHSKNYS